MSESGRVQSTHLTAMGDRTAGGSRLKFVLDDVDRWISGP